MTFYTACGSAGGKVGWNISGVSLRGIINEMENVNFV